MSVELFTQAWAEAEASCPPNAIMIDTMEFRHESLDPPLRICSDDVEHDFTLEDDAPVHGGTARTFVPCPLRATLRVVETEDMPRIDFEVDNIGRDIMPYCRASVQTRDPVILRYRAYILSDPENVGYGPIEFTVSDMLVNGSTFSASATILPFQKMEFPTKTYDRSIFAALMAAL